MILITETDNYCEDAISLYQKIGKVWLSYLPKNQYKEIKILVIRLKYMIDENYLSMFPSLEIIVSPTTGLTHIDVLACQKKSVKIFTLNNIKTEIDKITSTSELTLGLIISLLRMIPKASNDVVYKNSWDRYKYSSRQLSNLSLGIIGLGRIGGHLARYANALGMKVYAHDPFQHKGRFDRLEVMMKKLDDLLSLSDIISINSNLTDENHGLISYRELSLTRKNALIVNTSRGMLLDENAVADYIRSYHLGGVAVDVLAHEHSHESFLNSPLIQLAKEGYNVIVTPHIGGCTTDAMKFTEFKMAELTYKNLNGLVL